MQLITRKQDMRQAVKATRARRQTIGLVPTMGALHEGHIELIRRARSYGGLVVVSVFVNPLQFSAREDLDSYPRNLAQDLAVAGASGADVIFHPQAAEMYPAGHAARIEMGRLSAVLCGASRPQHFAGVATVVAKLFNIVAPDRAFFGQKDFQQTVVIRRMVAALDFPIDIIVVPTVRHEDGLALSSRNAYLSAEERQAAVALSESLEYARHLVAGGERDGAALAAAVWKRLANRPLVRIDYAEAVNPETLEPAYLLDGPVLIAVAAQIGVTRLIDNILIDPRSSS